MTIYNLHKPIKDAMQESMTHLPPENFSVNIMQRISALHQTNIAVPTANVAVGIALFIAALMIALPFIASPTRLKGLLMQFSLPEVVVPTYVWISIFGVVCLYVLNEHFSRSGAHAAIHKNR